MEVLVGGSAFQSGLVEVFNSTQPTHTRTDELWDVSSTFPSCDSGGLQVGMWLLEVDGVDMSRKHPDEITTLILVFDCALQCLQAVFPLQDCFGPACSLQISLLSLTNQ